MPLQNLKTVDVVLQKMIQWQARLTNLMNNISNEGKQDLIETYSKTTQMGKMTRPELCLQTNIINFCNLHVTL